MLLAHYKRFVDGAWYSSVGHGLGLLGLCAPMAYARGIEDLYVAATHWDGIDLEWGSRPDIDDYVRWSGTRCHHDAYELTRQERLDAIADYVETDAPDLQLQTCNVRMDGNCGECEKCYRTAVGLRLSGLEPSDHATTSPTRSTPRSEPHSRRASGFSARTNATCGQTFATAFVRPSPTPPRRNRSSSGSTEPISRHWSITPSRRSHIDSFARARVTHQRRSTTRRIRC